MKILHVLSSNSFSGAENVACQIIEIMQTETGVESAYCSADGSIRDSLQKRGIKFFPMKKLCTKELKRVIGEYAPDVIHAHDMRAGAVSAMAAKGIRIVSHIHNSDFKSRKVSVKSLIYLAATLKFSNIIWVSNSCFEKYFFHKLLAKKSKILYNVIDGDDVISRAAADNGSYNYDIAYVGRLADPKNPLRLMRIVALIKEKKPDVKVAVVGSGDLDDITKQTAKELSINENVVFHGFMSNPLGVLKSSKVMVMTSDREGTPMVSLEAMALGVPIVSTPTDGLCDLVKPGVTGYLESDENAFAKKVLEIITNQTIRENFSKATLQEFARINNIDKYKDVLDNAYGRK